MPCDSASSTEGNIEKLLPFNILKLELQSSKLFRNAGVTNGESANFASKISIHGNYPLSDRKKVGSVICDQIPTIW